MIETTEVTIPAQRAADARTEQAVAAYHRAWRAMVLAFPSSSCSAEAGIVRARTGLPVAAFNGIWGASRDVDPADVLAAVDEFAAGDLPWNLQLRPGYSTDLASALAGRDLVETEAIPFMVVTDLERLQTTMPAEADVRDLASFVDLDSTLGLLERGFGMPPALTRHLFPIHLFSLAGTSTSIVRDESVDVSTGLAVTDGDMCGVFNVATPAEHRGRGHGATATAHAVLQGAARGATTAYLQASPMGFPVYERLGFATVERWQQWMPRQLVAAGG